MKNIFLKALVSGFILFQSCGNASNDDSVDTAKDANEEKLDANAEQMPDTATGVSASSLEKKDADFAVEAANGSMMEVEMGKIAESRAMNSRVKNFATMMVTDHSKAGDDLRKLATSKNITLPGSVGDDAKKHMEDLNKKTGNDFDEAYMKFMLDDHKEDIKKFEEAVKNCKDPELKAFAAQALPVLYKHLDSAKLITNKK